MKTVLIVVVNYTVEKKNQGCADSIFFAGADSDADSFLFFLPMPMPFYFFADADSDADSLPQTLHLTLDMLSSVTSKRRHATLLA